MLLGRNSGFTPSSSASPAEAWPKARPISRPPAMIGRPVLRGPNPTIPRPGDTEARQAQAQIAAEPEPKRFGAQLLAPWSYWK